MPDTITVDGKEYVSKEKYDIDISKKESILPRFNMICREPPMDQHKVMAIGTATLGGEWIRSRIDYRYVERALKILRTLNEDADFGIDFVFSNDQPIIIGRVSEDHKSVTGVIIAPRIENS